MKNISDNSDAKIADVSMKDLAESTFKSSREAKNMSVEDAARQIRLSVNQILALEQDNFAKLPHASITRGFIRNYARLLEIDATPFLEAYRAKMPDVDQSKLSLTSERIVIKNIQNKSYIPYLIVGLILLVSLAVWGLYTYEYKTKIRATINQMTDGKAITAPLPHESSVEVLPPQALSAAERVAEENPTVMPTTTDTTVVKMPIEPLPTKTLLEKSQTVQPEPVTSVNKSDVSNLGNETAKLKVSQTTWVQLVNVAGEVIYERTLAEGSAESFDFKPPVKMIIGNASGAQLIYKNNPVDLLIHAKNNIAHISLD